MLRSKGPAVVAGVVLAVGVAIYVLRAAPGQDLVYYSYDQPFQKRGFIYPTEAVLVFLDDASHIRLHQKYNEPWNRGFYTQLLKRLTAEKAKAVVFDIVFSDAMDPVVDQEFAQAMIENGNVVLAEDFSTDDYNGGGLSGSGKFAPVLQLFKESAADVGSDALTPDNFVTVRRYQPGPPRVNTTNSTDLITAEEYTTSSEAWAAAVLYNPELSHNLKLRNSEFWLNYYGPELSLPAVSLYKALTNNDPNVPPGYFSNKVVFVGERLQTKLQASRKDEYSTPFSYLPPPNSKFTCGVAIHATAFLNLIRGDYLKRLDLKTEQYILIATGILFGAGLMFLRPLTATVVALGLLYPLWLLNYYIFRDYHYWFPWVLPLVFQIPIAAATSVVFNSLQLYVQKKQVEQSLRLYLPARLVKKFSSDPSLLKPGAKKQHLTILFSDIAGFTSITEGMDPDELAKLMNAYFQSAVDECIHFTEGTIVKYIGDAIFAFWNAPDPQDDHPFRAAEAALRFRDQDKHEFNGKKVLTRIGLHTGEANVGNFGSTTRVDYTAFGENINLSSRMEGLNKYLGTRVLMTGDTYEGIGSRLITRYLGLFRLKGFEKAVHVYELVDRPENGERTSELRQRFAQALELFRKKDFAGAEAAFRRILESNPQDGPCKFFLEHIEHLHSEELPPEWKGEITLKEK